MDSDWGSNGGGTYGNVIISLKKKKWSKRHRPACQIVKSMVDEVFCVVCVPASCETVYVCLLPSCTFACVRSCVRVRACARVFACLRVDCVCVCSIFFCDSDGCMPITNANISGNIALIDQGSCVFERKAFMAQEVNASAVVIIFNDEQLKLMMPAENVDVWGVPDPGHPIVNPYFANVFIPVIGITKSMGDMLKDHLWYKTVRLNWIEDQYATANDFDLEGNNSPLSAQKTKGP
uniref:PA domain-containing protein n=1 Tax=Lotharella globosa TaxID=91324 RepID=A0A7S3Z379_9EUKA|mmetsp:Transcript_22975/g.46146  ORF Transcript_22975/g.46146 Transcript_22975/m.46146 type:complete len:235 (+) Transcript_22975:266-970(+)